MRIFPIYNLDWFQGPRDGKWICLSSDVSESLTVRLPLVPLDVGELVVWQLRPVAAGEATVSISPNVLPLVSQPLVSHARR